VFLWAGSAAVVLLVPFAFRVSTLGGLATLMLGSAVLVMTAIVDLAAGLRLGTIAEGVETAEQVALLRELGCQRAQGFYFSRPVPEPDATRLIAASVPAEATPAGDGG
jgi:sensor c-di-GMP phosphodiesterase-like protein